MRKAISRMDSPHSGQTSGRTWWIRATSAAQREETRRELERAVRREKVKTGRGGVVCGKVAASPAEATTADWRGEWGAGTP